MGEAQLPRRQLSEEDARRWLDEEYARAEKEGRLIPPPPALRAVLDAVRAELEAGKGDA